MVVTRSKKKSIPEYIELSSTEEDGVLNDDDFPVISEKSSQDQLPSEVDNDISNANIQRIQLNNNETAVDIYIPKSKFNIYLVDDNDDVTLSNNVLLKHQLLTKSSFSITLDQDFLVVNEVKGNSSVPKEAPMLVDNTPQHGTEDSDEFFSANEDKAETQLKENSQQNIEDDYDMDMENLQGEQDDIDEANEESDTDPSESQNEPLDANSDAIDPAQRNLEVSLQQEEDLDDEDEFLLPEQNDDLADASQHKSAEFLEEESKLDVEPVKYTQSKVTELFADFPESTIKKSVGSVSENIKPNFPITNSIVEEEIIVEDPKVNIDNIMKNDMFAYVSSSDDEEEEEEEEKSVVLPSLPLKRPTEKLSDDDLDDFSDVESKKQKTNNKSMSEVDMFFADDFNDDGFFNVPATKVQKKTHDVKDAKKALAALMPSLGTTQVVKRRSTPSVKAKASASASEKSPSVSKENSVLPGNVDSTNINNLSPNESTTDIDEKIKVTFISQLTGFSKCVVIVSLKKKKTLRSISDKIIQTIIKQRPGSVYTYTSDDCSFYHKGVKLNKFNTVADIHTGPSENNIEITIVSADVEKELFKTSYEKMKSLELEEGKLKKMNDQMDIVDANFNQIDEELKKMETIAAEKYTEEIGEVEAAEDAAVDDGKFSIKLLDKYNNPLVVRVTGDMTIANVLEMYKKDNDRAKGLKIVIMFDGDVVELTDTLEDLGLEDDDMLEFVFK